MVNYKIPVYQPELGGNERKYVLDCLDSGWISSKGKYVSLFENSFAEYVGLKHAASVSNGTVALHLAMLALGIGPGDEVIVPTLTYISSVNAIMYAGAKPVFVDSLSDTWQIDPLDVEAKITINTKAIMAVHLYGHPCDMDALTFIAKKNRIYLIEDCAEAIGSKYKGQNVGTFGDISTFSFFGNKTITTGEGGMVLSNNKKLHEKVVHLKGQGLAKNREYWHNVIGYNYRMTNICAAIGLAQIEQVQDFIDRKARVAERYREHFHNSNILYHLPHNDVTHAYWMCSILVPDPVHREPIRDYLKSCGIETRPLFYPIHTMPMYSINSRKYIIAEDLASRGVNLPSFPSLSDDQIDYIANSIKKYYDEKNS